MMNEDQSKEQAPAQDAVVDAMQDEQVKLIAGKFKPSDIFKMLGLLAFFVLMGVVFVLVWPLVHQLFEPGGAQILVEDLKDAGPKGAFVLLALQFLQIVVVIIPGEVTQLAAGMMFGPWLGAAIILLGCVLSSYVIFQIVHRFGAPFVQDLVPMKHLEKIQKFEKSGKLDMLVFVLFLIPGLPKDAFTYLCPLTNIEVKHFLFLTTLGRFPGVLLSTYAANHLVNGKYLESFILFAVTAAIAIVGILFQDRITAFMERFSKK